MTNKIDNYITTTEASAFLNLDTRQIRRLCQRGILDFQKINSRMLLISKESCHDYLTAPRENAKGRKPKKMQNMKTWRRIFFKGKDRIILFENGHKIGELNSESEVPKGFIPEYSAIEKVIKEAFEVAKDDAEKSNIANIAGKSILRGAK